MEEAPEDAGGCPSLFRLCARTVSGNMERLEEDVWGLPAVILQDLLPLLNIYYLERIEPAASRKGLSTQNVWGKLFADVMRNASGRLMAVPCWRKKFLETFFHSVLRGTLDVSSDRRLHDDRFSPLEHSARYVSELTIFGKQQGVSELSPAVLDRLAQSVESLKFLHLRLSDAVTQNSLRRLLHRLIHHGAVTKVSVLSWPRPDAELLRLILKMSAGYWEEEPCALCAHSALLSLQPLNISRAPGPPTDPDSSSDEEPAAADLYDLIFQYTEEENNAAAATADPFVPGAIRLHSVTTLNLHNVCLSHATCRYLCQLLPAWLSLERLTMAYNDLQTNIGLLLDALSDLSRNPGRSLSAVSLCDFSTYLPILDLAQTFLRIVPGLQSLLLCYDLEETSDKVLLEAGPTEFPVNQLKQLNLRFPHTPVDARRLVSALKASPELAELSLDNAVFTRPEDVRMVLKTITEYNGALQRVVFHDVNLNDAQPEVLSLLSHRALEEVKFSFCRLFEQPPRDFLPAFVGALKKNSVLKILKLGGNRLGNKGLCALADLYAADSSSSVHCLDVSSNCLTSAGLLQFAQKLEVLGMVKLRRLLITQNGLETDAITTHAALRKLQGICCVMKDSWDRTQAFADHVSVM